MKRCILAVFLAAVQIDQALRPLYFQKMCFSKSSMFRRCKLHLHRQRHPVRLREVEAAARLKVTGLVANTHMMDETTPEIVRAGIRSARDLETATGIPVRFCAMQCRLAEAFGGPNGAADHLPILALERYIVAPFAPRLRGARRSSTVV